MSTTFKIWSCDRQKKKLVAASSLLEVKQKGCCKLEIDDPPDQCQLVLEADGTEVDEDDVLLSEKGQILLLLRPTEQWASQASETIPQKTAADKITASATCPKKKLENTEPVKRDLQPVELPDTFTSVPKLKRFLERILSAGEVPKDFMDVLVLSCAKNDILKRELLSINALPFWSERDEAFERPWDLQSIKSVLARISYPKRLSNASEETEGESSTIYRSEEHWLPKRSDSEKRSFPVAAVGPYSVSTKTGLSVEDGDYEQPRPVRKIVRAEHSKQQTPTITTATNGGHHSRNETADSSVTIRFQPSAGRKRVSYARTSQSDYYKLRKILLPPEISSEHIDSLIEKALPYIIQHVKMRGYHVLHASSIASLIQESQACRSRKKSDPFENVTASKAGRKSPTAKLSPVARIDCLTHLFESVEDLVAQDLLSVMSQYPMALPLVRRTVESDHYVLMIPLLRGINLKWESSGGIIENFLFVDPFRLIVAVRLGSNPRGKSTILNQMLAKEHTFSSRDEPGSEYGKPSTLEGSVEMVWLTQETCKESVWETVLSKFYAENSKRNEVVLLANLHGDVMDHTDLLTFSSQFSCHYLVFLMPDCGQRQWDEFKGYVGSQVKLSFIRVDPSNYRDLEETEIQTSNLTASGTLQKVRNALKEAVWSCASVSQLPSNLNLGKLIITSVLHTTESEKLIAFVKQNTCKGTRKIMRLQTARRNDESREAVLGERRFGMLIELFSNCLSVPGSNVELAVVRIEKELSRLSNDESRSARLEVVKRKAELRRTVGNANENQMEVNSLKQQILDSLDEIDSMNLGLEHFFREIGQVYQLVRLKKNKFERQYAHLLNIPDKVASMFIAGQAIELLDGDAVDIPMVWLSAVWQRVNAICPKLRVYVISIIGLQSSGKSTLLNSLFACRFAVSVGRCSRGLFMRLLFLDKELSKTSKYDAILLIDTEGLGSPEKMNDPDAEKKDRMLATFAMGISNLTLINVLGETMTSLAEIMQIAVVAMARLEKAQLAPDVLMVQHLLTEKASDKTSQAEEQFVKAIENAIELADKKDVQVGVRNAKCLTQLFARVRSGAVLTQFHPFKDGATSNAPPSKAYHQDVVELYNKIIERSKSSKDIMEFQMWYSIVEGYWNAVSREDFALRFKDAKEIYEFIDRGDRIAAVKVAIDAAFSSHVNELQKQIKAKEFRPQGDTTKYDWRAKDFDHEFLDADIGQHLKRIPNDCPGLDVDVSTSRKFCKKCRQAIDMSKALYEHLEGKPYQDETINTLNEYQEHVCHTTIKKLSLMMKAKSVQQFCSVEFEKEISRRLESELKRCKPGQFQEKQREKIADSIYQMLVDQASQMPTDKTMKEKFIDELKNEYHQYPDIVERFSDIPMGGAIVQKLKAFENQRSQKSAFWTRLKNKLSPKDTQMTKEILHLQSTVSILPKVVLEKRKADCFEHGMVRDLKGEVNKALRTFAFQSCELDACDKLNVHVWAQQSLFKRLEELQTEWDKNNQPLMILEANKKRYREMIHARLEYGFSCMSEGIIMGQNTLTAIKKNAIEAENCQRIRSIQDLVWTTNSQMIRLKYLKKLARGVSRKNKEAAVQHFKTPGTEIEKWYASKIDSFRTESYGSTYKTCFERESKKIMSDIRRTQTSAELCQVVEDYLRTADVSYSNSSFNATKMTSEEFGGMVDTVVGHLENNTQVNVEANEFRLPSKSVDVMSRLGCTERCFWCGALCWGQRGHGDNKDETRKHHTSHQPVGLAGTNHRYTFHLLSMPCHEFQDEGMVYFGEFRDSGILWKEAKENYFSNWKFEKHYIDQFDSLMRWFFQELHVDIAKSHSVKPATETDMNTYRCDNLRLDDILPRIQTAIK